MAHPPLKIACVLAPNLPIQVERQKRDTPLPLIVAHPIETNTVLACSEEAAAAGVQAGMSLYQAQQMAPTALVLAPDELAYHSCHGAIQAALQNYSPLVETVGLGEFLLDARAIAAQHGGDDALAAALAQAASAASGLVVRVGLAAGQFTAQQAARQLPELAVAGVGPASATLVVPPDGEARFLAPLPVEVLPGLPGEVRRRLHLFDVYTLGDLARLPKAAVLRQFGGELAGLYQLARGDDPRPLNPDVPPLRLVRSLRLPTPTTQRLVLLRAAQRLSWQLAKILNHKGYHAEALQLTVYYADGRHGEIGQSAKPPTSDEARLSRLAGLLLGKLALAAPVTALALSVYPLRAWHHSAHQVELVRAGVPERLARFEQALQLLTHRFGQAIVRVAALLGPPVPIPIQVTLDGQGQPASLVFGGLTRRVRQVHETWREERWWWDTGRALARDYYRVMLLDETYRNIFQDRHTENWYLDRAWPIL